MLEQEVVKVKNFQDSFYTIFKSAAQTEEKLKLSRSENQKVALENFQGNDVISYAFSDSLIFFASLNTQQNRLVPVSSCLSILTALVGAQLSALAKGRPFRGGVEIGRAALFNGNQILGPALSDAVKLEEQAQFPRILVGNGFHDYLQQQNSESQLDSPENNANREFAKICISLICKSDEPCQLHEPDQANEHKTRVLSLDVHSVLAAK